MSKSVAVVTRENFLRLHEKETVKGNPCSFGMAIMPYVLYNNWIMLKLCKLITVTIHN